MTTPATDPLEFMRQQKVEHAAWLAVVEELRARDAGALNAGEKDEGLHDAIVRWGEELVQLRMADPVITHAMDALDERRVKYPLDV